MKGIKTSTILILALLLTAPVFAADYKEGEVIVRFNNNSPFASVNALGETVNQAGTIAVDDTAAAITELNNRADVAYAEPNYIIEAEDLTPDDYSFSGSEYSEVQLPRAWGYINSHRSRQQVTIAVIDSGVDLDHPELAGVLMPGYDFANHDATPEDNSGHGTKVCGIIGAKGDNNRAVAGVCWNSNIRIMPLKFMEKNGSKTTGYLSDAVSAIRYAVDHGADVINASWGFTSTSQALAEAISYAEANGVLFVCSAGNSGKDNDKEAHFPSNYTHDNLIAVAALNRYGELASFSNFGHYSVDIAAPGTGLESTDLGGGHETWCSGTSFAAPFVTATCALIIAQNPELGSHEVRERLLETTSMDSSFSADVIDNGGCLDAWNAITAEDTHSVKSGDGFTPPAGQVANEGSESEGGSGGGGCFINQSETTSGLALILALLATLMPVMRPRKK